MSLANRAGDLYYTFRFMKILTTKWEETDAYKLGLIDENGKRIKTKKINTDEEKTAYSTFFRLVFNIKRLLEKLPGGKNTLASYAAALFLLREKFDLSDKSINKILDKMGIEPLDFMAEKTLWYVLDDKQLSPGVYRLREEKVDINNLQDVANTNDKIRISDRSYPIGEIFGLDIYEATHINSNQKLYVTLGEIYK